MKKIVFLIILFIGVSFTMVAHQTVQTEADVQAVNMDIVTINKTVYASGETTTVVIEVGSGYEIKNVRHSFEGVNVTIRGNVVSFTLTKAQIVNEIRYSNPIYCEVDAQRNGMLLGHKVYITFVL